MLQNHFEKIEKSFELNKEVQDSLEKFIEGDSELENIGNFKKLNQLLNSEEITKYRENAKYFLHLISSISKNHHRSANFFNKIEQILLESKN